MPSSKRATVKWQQNISEVAYKVGIESSKENELKVKFHMTSRSKKKAKDHPLLWVVESLMEVPSYLAKPMFGCIGIYLHGRLMLVLASGEVTCPN